MAIKVKSGWEGDIKDSPIKNCPGFKASVSFGSKDRAHGGREFKIASICTNEVVSFLYVRISSPTTLRRWYLIDLMPAFYIPLKYRAPAGLKCQSTPLRAMVFCLTLEDEINKLSSQRNSAAPTKCIPWSLYMMEWQPRWATRGPKKFLLSNLIQL